MQVDEGLLMEVQLKATGANVHKLASQITAYKGSIEASNAIQDTEKQERLFSIAKRVEVNLRKFVVTGVLQ